MVLTIAMWTMSHSLPFGNCSSIKFVFMFAVALPAPSSGRAVALTFASLTLAIFTVLTCIEVRVWMKRGRFGSHGTNVAGVLDPVLDPGRVLSHEHRKTKPARHSHQIHDPARQHHGRHDRFHKRWAGSLHRLGCKLLHLLVGSSLTRQNSIFLWHLSIANVDLSVLYFYHRAYNQEYHNQWVDIVPVRNSDLHTNDNNAAPDKWTFGQVCISNQT